MISEDTINQLSKTTDKLWYVEHGDLLHAEVEAMSKLFPDFKMDKMDDDRLCWSGNLYPNGKSGKSWTVMAVYENNHPGVNSVKVYPIKPD